MSTDLARIRGVRINARLIGHTGGEKRSGSSLHKNFAKIYFEVEKNFEKLEIRVKNAM